ncbi:MAG TPA: FtsX-like permease family protein [Humisphaera sp.]|nr:FtsX-like permease family protein [Humisphaera sp.]
MYKLHLILKYLLKRRIAWVSLIAVMLCTTMVLVVISVMGGWLNMFKGAFRGLSGEIVVRSQSMAGFPYYQEMAAELEKDPDIAAAVPTIETYGLINFGRIGTLPGVKVMGIPIEQIGRINSFPNSLYRQHIEIEQELAKPNLSADQRKALERQLSEPPTFDLWDVMSVPMDALPAGLSLATPETDEDLHAGSIALPENFPPDLRKELRGRFWYDAARHNLDFEGRMQPQWKDALASLSADPKYRQAIESLYQQSTTKDFPDYEAIIKSKSYGMIVGVGVLGIRRDQDAEWIGRDPWKFATPVKLTVLGVQEGGALDIKNKSERNYFVVDDSRIGVWQYDNSYVYVPLDRLQKDLGMAPITGGVNIDTGKPEEIPGRVTELHIRTQPGIDPNDETALRAVCDRSAKIVNGVLRRHYAGGGFSLRGPAVEVKTWQDEQRLWINAVENEKLLTVVLFAIISIVAIFLIFCIFYMIVVEKTRDIGIIKSVGATSAGVAGIFLGYGLVIGILGAAMGLALSYGIVHNINELHAGLGKLLHVQIWNPEVYLFDKIPNQMSGKDIAVILPIAVISCVLGALVPAVRAATMNPVEALRWE